MDINVQKNLCLLKREKKSNGYRSPVSGCTGTILDKTNDYQSMDGLPTTNLMCGPGLKFKWFKFDIFSVLTLEEEEEKKICCIRIEMFEICHSTKGFFCRCFVAVVLLFLLFSLRGKKRQRISNIRTEECTQHFGWVMIFQRC